MDTTDGSTGDQRVLRAAPEASGPRPSSMTGRFRVVSLGADGVGRDASDLDRGTAIAYAQALQHRVSVRGHADGAVYEVLDDAGEPVWRGHAPCGMGALHPRTAEFPHTTPAGGAGRAA